MEPAEGTIIYVISAVLHLNRVHCRAALLLPALPSASGTIPRSGVMHRAVLRRLVACWWKQLFGAFVLRLVSVISGSRSWKPAEFQHIISCFARRELVSSGCPAW